MHRVHCHARVVLVAVAYAPEDMRLQQRKFLLGIGRAAKLFQEILVVWWA